MIINDKANELIQKLMQESPNTKLTIGLLYEGEMSFKLFDKTGEIPYQSYAYEIASISKVFTTSLFAKMLHEGKMDLNDSVVKYIPELDENKYYPTLRRLATHTAGNGSEALKYSEMVKVIVKGLLMHKRKKPSSYWTDFIMDYDKLVWHTKRYKFKDKDYKWLYTDYSIALLGEAICQMKGIPYEKLMKEFLEVDLGLQNTKTITDRPDMLDGYFYNQNVGTMKGYRSDDYTAPAGGITSTAEDMLKFAKMNIEENPKFLARAHEITPIENPHFDMGLGWWVWNKGGNAKNPAFSHTGGSEGFSSSLTFLKNAKSAVVVLINTYGYDASEISNAIFHGNLLGCTGRESCACKNCELIQKIEKSTKED